MRSFQHPDTRSVVTSILFYYKHRRDITLLLLSSLKTGTLIWRDVVGFANLRSILA